MNRALQVLQAVLKNPEDRTEVSLIYANNTTDDILLRTQLDELASKHDNFKVWYTGAPLPSLNQPALSLFDIP